MGPAGPTRAAVVLILACAASLRNAEPRFGATNEQTQTPAPRPGVF